MAFLLSHVYDLAGYQQHTFIFKHKCKLPNMPNIRQRSSLFPAQESDGPDVLFPLFLTSVTFKAIQHKLHHMSIVNAQGKSHRKTSIRFPMEIEEPYHVMTNDMCSLVLLEKNPHSYTMYVGYETATTHIFLLQEGTCPLDCICVCL